MSTGILIFLHKCLTTLSLDVNEAMVEGVAVTRTTSEEEDSVAGGGILTKCI